MKKILICLMTTQKNKDRQNNIKNTWLKNSQVEYLFYSDHEDVEHNIIKVSNRTDYHSNEEKHINCLNYVLQNKLNYEWYYFCDDDTFVNVNNLFNFIDKCEKNKIYGSVINYKNSPENPIYNKILKNIQYPSGGAGYLINNLILKSFEEFKNYNVGFSDVSFGINMHNKFEIVDPNLFFSQAPEFYKHNYEEKLNSISYHYIKTLPQILNLMV